MALTPQERLTLGVATLLLALGAVARYGRPVPEPFEWAAPEAEAAPPASPGMQGAVEEGIAREREASTALATGERLNPNTATATQLDRLPRVGPALAARIVQHREAQGPFRTLADLDAVPGVGPAMLASLAPLLTLPAGPAAAPATLPPMRPPALPAAPARSATVNINTATAADLEALPGIGPALAGRIVQYRAEHGPFREIADLAKVRGIGPKILERIQPFARAGY